MYWCGVIHRKSWVVCALFLFFLFFWVKVLADVFALSLSLSFMLAIIIMNFFHVVLCLLCSTVPGILLQKHVLVSFWFRMKIIRD
ncbi:hypothetical protein BX666DRAFT_1985196 [Dichotomocladium elegans]|nr:hypothetical protein BX666DRAFT_1985196 [Dichotomocladium elegans]